MRFLNDVIILCVHANPDGMELVANWYMRETDPMKRRTTGVPRLYNKYVGHDDNRDFYMSNLPRSTNMNRVMYREWFPQIMYNHHQTGPAGTVMFAPPFRDPFNYNFDPLVPIGIDLVGAAMQSRLVAEDKPGVTMRKGSQLFHVVERRPAHDGLLPQHDRHPDRDHRQPDADDDSVHRVEAVARFATCTARSSRRTGTSASRSTTR